MLRGWQPCMPPRQPPATSCSPASTLQHRQTAAHHQQQPAASQRPQPHSHKTIVRAAIPLPRRLRSPGQELHHRHWPDNPQHARGAAREAGGARGRVAQGHRGAVRVPAHRGGGRAVHVQPAGAVRGGGVVAQGGARGAWGQRGGRGRQRAVHGQPRSRSGSGTTQRGQSCTHARKHACTRPPAPAAAHAHAHVHAACARRPAPRTCRL